jgi:hypothetical protein
MCRRRFFSWDLADQPITFMVWSFDDGRGEVGVRQSRDIHPTGSGGHGDAC